MTYRELNRYERDKFLMKLWSEADTSEEKKEDVSEETVNANNIPMGERKETE